MDVGISLPVGQEQARTRWGTHESGAAFDRKKTPYLTEQAQKFIAQQALCVIAGPGPEDELCGLLAMGEPGFVKTPDTHTCLLQLDSQYSTSRLLQGVGQSSFARLGLFFICHPTRERLCVQGVAELLPEESPALDEHSTPSESILVRLRVGQAFFHCVKYIRTRVAGLTTPFALASEQWWRPEQLLNCHQTGLSETVCDFISQQVLCFLCTVDQEGQCAVNHRGGAPGFLVTLPPDKSSPGGIVLLPDYAGNGAFEAIGNILETGRATLVIPNYAAQLAICVSGPAYILEPEDLAPELVGKCTGAERVVALSVQCVETQYGDWSVALAYERARAASLPVTGDTAPICSV